MEGHNLLLLVSWLMQAIQHEGTNGTATDLAANLVSLRCSILQFFIFDIYIQRFFVKVSVKKC